MHSPDTNRLKNPAEVSANFDEQLIQSNNRDKDDLARFGKKQQLRVRYVVHM